MTRWCLVVVAALGLAGCARGTPAISNNASKSLQAKVAQIRTAASAHDAPAVAAEVAALRAQVADLSRRHQLSAAAARKILDAATAVDENLSVITTTTTATTSPSGHGHGDGDANEGGD